jgi:hypothetical protein
LFWVLAVCVIAAGWFVRKIYVARRRNIAATLTGITVPLALQATLFPHELGETAEGRAADRFSSGYIYAFSVSMLIASGRSAPSTFPPFIGSAFVTLFGPGAERRLVDHSNAMRAGDAEARRGADTGRADAKKYIESGYQRSVTGWLQHVRQDPIEDLAPERASPVT